MTEPLKSSDDSRHSIDDYKQLLETLNVVPWEFHWKSQKFIYVGPQVSLFGYPLEDWYTEGFWLKIIHPEDIEKTYQCSMKAAENQEDYDHEFRLIRANGECCWIRNIVRILEGRRDSLILQGVFVDISAQKQAEEVLVAQNRELRRRDIELSAKNEQFNAAINHMPQGLSMFDSKKRLIVCNSRYASLYQLPPELTRPGTAVEELMKYRVENGVIPADAHHKFISECMAAVDLLQPYTAVQELTDGRLIEARQAPMASGGWLSTHEDITERRRAEKFLRESQEALSIAFRLSPVSMTISDLDNGKHIEVNDAWSTMLGYSYKEAQENTSLELGVWHDPEMRIRFVRKITKKGRVRGLEAKLLTKDGQVVDVLLSGETAEINGRRRLLIACHDITRRKKTEHELIAHRDHLQQLVDTATLQLKAKAKELEKSLGKEKELNELQRQFVSMTSHEFRTPLAIIDGAAQRLIRLTGKNKLTPEDAIERYGKIRASVQRMTRLMESTLTAARIEEGKINVEIGPCHIGKTINEVCLRHQDITENHIITCSLEGIPDLIQADTGAVEQVLTNLLSNAEKYAPFAPDIEVKAYTEGSDVVISVRDYGVGIDEDELDKIGERFFRARTSVGIPGTGIGLNLSRKLLDLHGGSIQVESRKIQGSTFFIRIPIAGPQRSQRNNTLVA